MLSSLKRLIFPAFTVIALSLGTLQPAVAAPKEEYSFVVKNDTDATVKQLLVSEDKKTWGKFDIGKGIGAGTSVKLTWGEHTNNQKCEQWVKAIFNDGSESKMKKFDFCEEDLVIEFSE